MGGTSILALLGVIEEILKDTPEAVAMFKQVEALFMTGTEPTLEQWTALDVALSAHHAALQAA